MTDKQGDFAPEHVITSETNDAVFHPLDHLSDTNPVLAHVTRGKMVESLHRGAVVVVDTQGQVIFHKGSFNTLIYARSAIKPLQTLALLETGAADAYGVSEAELALASASHEGEPMHVDAVQNWLERLNLGVRDLECGAQVPYDPQAAATLLRENKRPSALHNNCSGKHAGFLTLAKHLGAPTVGYVDYTHPVQQRILGILEMMTGLDLRQSPRGIDGCGIPQIGIPLGNLALAMARLGDPRDQPDSRQNACARVLDSIRAYPDMIAGPGQFVTQLIKATKGRIIVKSGAEGVYTATLPEPGLGLALKIDDGAKRAAEVALGATLKKLDLLDRQECQSLSDFLTQPITNRPGALVGEVRPADTLS